MSRPTNQDITGVKQDNTQLNECKGAIFLKELNFVRVVIDGEIYELTSEERPDHIKSVATYIDEKIKELYRQKNNGYHSPKHRTLFISLNIADDLFKEKDKASKFEKENIQLSESLQAYMSENEILLAETELHTEKIKELEEALESTQKELQEFIDSFPAKGK